MSHYAMLSKHGNYTQLLKIKNKLKIGCFRKYYCYSLVVYMNDLALPNQTKTPV